MKYKLIFPGIYLNDYKKKKFKLFIKSDSLKKNNNWILAH